MSAYAELCTLLRGLPQGPDCSEEVVEEYAGRILFADRLMCFNDPLPKDARDAAREVVRDLEGYDRIAALTPGEPVEEIEQLRRSIDRNAHRIELKATRPTKDRARVVTQQVAHAYHTITGAPAPRSVVDGYASGPLVDLVTEVFTVLGISASARSQVKSLLQQGK